MGEAYKAEIIASIPAGEEVGLYRQGEFIDLCRGPHLPSTGKLGTAFKLMSIAGAYWRGDSRNEMLQRIYGTAWANDKDLQAYLKRLEEAEKRDHRRLGREMDLFHLQEEGPGSVFWHPKGWTLFQTMIGYMREKQRRAGYEEINTPEILDRELWVKSGHVEKFGENMYLTQTPDERVYAIKPMNCPGHVQVFKQGIKSYRDLPYYLAEFGKVHRYEPSGALHGIMRVRAFTQDDAHIFCTEEQITEECVKASRLVQQIYHDFGFDDVVVKFSDRPERRVGADEVWDHAETALRRALDMMQVEWSLNPGEGAFYGPKLEFVLRDAIGREWQCGTVQVDLNLPERLGATYVASRQQPPLPGDDPPRHVRLAGTLLRHSHRALRRPLPAVAGARADRGGHHHRRRRRLCARSARRRPRPRSARRGRPAQREDLVQGARAQRHQGAGHSGGGQARGRGAHRRCAPARRQGAGDDDPRCRPRSARR
jgi:threonyl-tRNA synthetase